MIAYCAPGQAPVVALQLALQGDFTTRVEETPHLAGHTDAYLVDPDAFRHYQPVWLNDTVQHHRDGTP